MFDKRRKEFMDELEKLEKGKYLEKETIDEVKSAYHLYLLDCLNEIRMKETVDKVQQKEEERREFLNHLIKKKNVQSIEKVSEKKKSIIETNQLVDKKSLQNLASKNPQLQREKNLSLLLTLGVILLLLGGLVLATTSWFMFGAITKVVLILSVSGLFGGMGFVAKKLKIQQTSFAFFSLALLFLPITIVSAAYYKLFGTYLSLTGDGRYLLGAITSCLFLSVYYQVAKKYQSTIFKWLSLGFVYLFLLFLTLFITPSAEQTLLILGTGLLGLFILPIYMKENAIIQFFSEERFNYQLIVLIISSIGLILTPQVTVSSIVTYLLFSVLYFISAIQWQKGELIFQLVGNSILYVGIFSILLLDLPSNDMFQVLIVAILLVSFSWLIHLKGIKRLSEAFIKRQLIISSILNSQFLVLGLGFIAVFGSPSIFVNTSMGEKVLLMLSSLILLSGMYRMAILLKKSVTCALFVLSSYIVVAVMFRLLELPHQMFIFSLCVVCILGYSLSFINQSLGRQWRVNGGISSVVFLISVSSIEKMVSVGEMTIWLAVIWLLLVATRIRMEPTNQLFFSWGLSFGLGIVALPLLSEFSTSSIAYLCVSGLLLGFGVLTSGIQKLDVKRTSRLISAIFYLLACLVLCIEMLLGVANWWGMLPLVLGIVYCAILKSDISLKYSSLGSFIFLIASLFYPVYLLDISNRSEMFYIEVVATLLFFLHYKLQKKVGPYTSYMLSYAQISSHLLFVLSFIAAAYFNEVQNNPLVYCLPILVYGVYFVQVNQLRMKRFYLSILLLLTYLFFYSTGNYMNFNWVTHAAILWVMSLALFGMYLKDAAMKNVVKPAGCLISSVAFIVMILLDYRVVNWFGIFASLTLWCIVIVYTKSILKKELDWLTWLGIFAIVAMELHSLPILIYSVILFSILFIHGALHYLSMKKILPFKSLERNSSFLLTAIGYFYLECVVLQNHLSSFQIGLMIYVSIYLFLFFRNEERETAKKSLATLFFINTAGCGYWALTYWEMYLYSPLILSIKITLGLLLLSLLIRKVWQLQPEYLAVEFIGVAVGLVALMSEALEVATLAQQLIFSILAILYLLVGFLAKFKSYFISGAVGIVLSILYNQRNLWRAIPWWLYLIIGGMLLILVASSAELRNRQKEEKMTIANKIKQFFASWN